MHFQNFFLGLMSVVREVVVREVRESENGQELT
jgi:hypothetical protein